MSGESAPGQATPEDGVDPDSTASRISQAGETRTGSDTRVLHLKEFDPPDDDGAPRRAPTQIGPYRILRQLGRGGMGSVYLAEPHASCPVPMGRLVAIKVLHRTDAEERRRFEREAAYLQSLRHPGIVRVLDAGEHDGRPFLVMQLIEGKRLDDLILKGPLPEREAAELTVQALEALHVAHLAGILHRDIKPGNIMLDRGGAVRILDFGLASHMHHESRLTRTGNVVGTPAYMSPEQASGARDAVARRSDVYGMGACLYELLTAFQPFTADNSVAVLRRIIDDPLVPPSQLRPGLARDLETVVMVAMAKDPRDRYPTAEAMAADLRRFLDGQRVRARRVSRAKLFARACWRHRRALAAASLAAFVALSSAGIAGARWLKHQRAEQERIAREQTRLASEAWTVARHVDGPIEAPDSGVHIVAHGPLGKGMLLAYLPTVPGSVRLSATVELIAPDARVELLVNDRDVGRGYRLRLEGSPEGDRLVLMREDKVVKSRSLSVKRLQPWRLSIERVDATLTVRLNDEQVLQFLDLVPIAGEDAGGAYVAYKVGAVAVRNVLLEHQEGPQVPGLLAGGDALAEAGNYARAIAKYDAFLRDHGDSPQARDARLRIALCMEALHDNEHALARFLEIAAAEKEPRYALTATFHAWSCALRAGDYDQAERLFDQVVHGPDHPEHGLETVVASIPEDTLKELLQSYLDRAEKLAATEPQRAEKLYTTAAELAVYLKRSSAVNQGLTGAGDVLASLGRLDEAKSLYFNAARDQAAPVSLRMKASLKMAEVERLQDRPAAAETWYAGVVKTPSLDDDTSQWARLWLGDLYLEQGDRDRALDTWRGSVESASRPGAIMALLAAAHGEIAATDDRFYANDVEYFNGRMALLARDDKRYREALRTVVRIGPAYDWPTPLAKHLLSLLPPEAPAPTPQPQAPSDTPSPVPAPVPATQPSP